MRYGLGLSLLYSLVTSMQGKISVEDNQPKGSKFIVTFPMLQME